MELSIKILCVNVALDFYCLPYQIQVLQITVWFKETIISAEYQSKLDVNPYDNVLLIVLVQG